MKRSIVFGFVAALIVVAVASRVPQLGVIVGKS